MSLPFHNSLFDIEDKRACWVKDTIEFLRDGQKPLHVPIRSNPSISGLSLIGIGRRGNDEIYALLR